MSDYDRYGSHNLNDPSRLRASSDARDSRRASDASRKQDAQSYQGTGSSRRVSGRTGSLPRDPGSTGSHRRDPGSTGAQRRDPGSTGAQRRSSGATGSTRPVSGDAGASGRLYRTDGFEKVGRESYARDRYARSGRRVEPTRGALDRSRSDRSSQGRNPQNGGSDLPTKILGIAKSGLGKVAGFVGSVAKRSKVALVAMVVVALIIVGAAFDGLTSIGKVHSRVTVGTVKAHGMTEAELAQALMDEYGALLDVSDVTVYRSEQAMSEQATNPVDSGNLSPEEQAAQTNYWKVNKDKLQAYVDYEGLAHEAYMAGREGILNKIFVFFFGKKIDVNVEFGEDELESLASTIDLTLGYSFTNSAVTVKEGTATASESKPGMMVDRDGLESTLSAKFLNPNVEERQFFETAIETQPKISTEEGQATADKVNAAIANGASFTYNQTSWTVDSTELGSWVNTQIVTDDKTGESTLQAFFDPQLATSDISEHAKAVFPNGEETVSFEKKDNGEVVVKLGSEGTMPQIRSSISKLNDALFADNANLGSAPSIVVDSTQVPSEMSFNDALNNCVISVISEFTTTYTADVYERNHNIQLAADKFDNNIVKANGGQWSFHDSVGPSDKEHGFLSAGSIVNGVMSEEEGGGICQAATTIFNAVYESGLPIVRRTNHSMYISSYPEGRDAAVSYPDLDFIWENDTSSDVLVKSSHTDTSVTVYLYGVSPGYTVETETGEWTDGTDYGKVTTYDESLAPGVSYVKTAGSKGHSITVVRTVKDKKGETVRTDTFVSVYDPTDEVTVRGGTAADWQ